MSSISARRSSSRLPRYSDDSLVKIGLPERSVNDCVYHESFSPQAILSPAARRHNGQVELLAVCPFNRGLRCGGALQPAWSPELRLCRNDGRMVSKTYLS